MGRGGKEPKVGEENQMQKQLRKKREKKALRERGDDHYRSVPTQKELTDFLSGSPGCVMFSVMLSVLIAGFLTVVYNPHGSYGPKLTRNLEKQMFQAVRICLAEAPGNCNFPLIRTKIGAYGLNPDTEEFPLIHANGYYLSHLAAGSDEPVAADVLDLLIKHGANVNRRAKKGLRPTPLYVAASHGLLPQATMLLSAGADVDAGDRLNTSPLYIAVQDGDLELVRLLLQHGAQVNNPTEEGWYGLNVAVTENRDLMAGKKLCERAGGCDYLYPAAVGTAQYENIVAALLSAGADPGLVNHDEGFPALHHAIRAGARAYHRTCAHQICR